jgi:hypothetical protein
MSQIGNRIIAVKGADELNIPTNDAGRESKEDIIFRIVWEKELSSYNLHSSWLGIVEDDGRICCSSFS